MGADTVMIRIIDLLFGSMNTNCFRYGSVTFYFHDVNNISLDLKSLQTRLDEVGSDILET